MSVYILSIILIALAIGLLFVAFKSLLKSGWFMKWLQGSAGFVSLLLTILFVLVTVDLLGYLKAHNEKPLATLTFTEISKQSYDVELVQPNSTKNLFRVNGDQWQLDVRLIQSPLFAYDGLPSYKLDRLSGRYLSLEQERTEKRTVHGLNESLAVDFWEYLNGLKVLGLLDAQYGSASFMPMVDGGIYQVVLTETGIKAEPINAIAKQAIETWQ